jgi:hypothetical protein
VLCGTEQAFLKKTARPFFVVDIGSTSVPAKLDKTSLFHTERRKTKREEKEAVILAVLSGLWRSGRGWEGGGVEEKRELSTNF